MQLTDLIDRAKEAAGSESDRAFAKHMKVSHGTISHWRNGRAYPDAISCERLAGLTGAPLAKVLGIVGEARAISREEKAVWRKLAATATLLLVVVVPALNPAAAYTPVGTAESPIALCIMRSGGPLLAVCCTASRSACSVDTLRPPCWPDGQDAPNSCAAAHYDRLIYNRTPLFGEWVGWRMAGRYLISPDGDRISPERLRGILWCESLGKRHGRAARSGLGVDHRRRDPAGVIDLTSLRGLATAPSHRNVQRPGTPDHGATCTENETATAADPTAATSRPGRSGPTPRP